MRRRRERSALLFQPLAHPRKALQQVAVDLGLGVRGRQRDAQLFFALRDHRIWPERQQHAGLEQNPRRFDQPIVVADPHRDDREVVVVLNREAELAQPLDRSLRQLPQPPAVLVTLQVELRQLVDGIAVRTRRNAFLLERAVAYIEGLLRIVMAPSTEPAPVYAATGQPAGRQVGPRLLDRNA